VDYLIKNAGLISRKEAMEHLHRSESSISRKMARLRNEVGPLPFLIKPKIKNRPYRRHYHRIWEEANGPLPDGCVIHHIDGDPFNNELANLECLTPSEHLRKHMSMLTPNGGVCPVCGNDFEARTFTPKKFCSEDCRLVFYQFGGPRLTEKTCERCGATFPTKFRRKRFCDPCAKMRHAELHKTPEARARFNEWQRKRRKAGLKK